MDQLKKLLNQTLKQNKNILHADLSIPASWQKIDFNTGKQIIWQQDVLTHPEIITSQLNLLSGNGQTIFARNCKVERITQEEADIFLAKNHLMGSTKAPIRYGLYHKNQIEAVMLFSRGRKMNRLPNNFRSFELIRSATALHKQITGGFSKLLKAFVKDWNPGDIMTYTDYSRWNGNSLKKLGFEPSGELKITKVYTNKNYSYRSHLPDLDGNNILVELKSNGKLILKLVNE